jgi:hypothetical protein
MKVTIEIGKRKEARKRGRKEGGRKKHFFLPL